MKLVPAALAGGHAEHGGSHGHHEEHGHGHEAPAGIEWEDDMVEVNRMTTPANMRWTIVGSGWRTATSPSTTRAG
jgi:hypothetical protein